MASVKPPVDKHSQNLTLHCIELQHHKRRMRLMLMAAQHQYGEAGVYDIDFSVSGNVTIIINVYFLCLGYRDVGEGEVGRRGRECSFSHNFISTRHNDYLCGATFFTASCQLVL